MFSLSIQIIYTACGINSLKCSTVKVTISLHLLDKGKIRKLIVFSWSYCKTRKIFLPVTTFDRTQSNTSSLSAMYWTMSLGRINLSESASGISKPEKQVRKSELVGALSPVNNKGLHQD